MKQQIYNDPYDFSDWDVEHSSRCFVHIANSLAWRTITGDTPPTTPLTAREYKTHGIPWFDYYSEGDTAVPGSGVLGKIKSIAQLRKAKGDVPLPENEPIQPERVVRLRSNLRRGQVREGSF